MIVNAIFTVGLTTLILVRGLLAANQLSPREYGIWGLVTLVLVSVVWVRDLGVVDRYVSQTSDDQNLAFQRAFTFDAILLGACAGLMLALAPAVAFGFGQPDALLPTIVLAASLPIAAIQFPIWTFYRSMDFKKQRLVQSVEPVFGLIVTVILLWLDTGYWALVGGVVAGTIASAVVAVAVSPYKLRWRFDRAEAADYKSFSTPVLISGFVGVAIGQGGFFALERIDGIAAIGMVTLAATITQYADKLDLVITQTLYPALCAASDRYDTLYEAFVKSNGIAMLWGIPFALGVALFSADLVPSVLGEQWRDATTVIAAIGLVAGMRQIAFNWHAFYKAIQDTRPLAAVALWGLAGFVAFPLPGLIWWGVDGFAYGLIGMEVVTLVARVEYVRRMFPARPVVRDLALPLRSAVLAAAVVVAARLLFEGEERGTLLVAGEIAVFLVVHVVATWKLSGGLLSEAVGYLRRPRPA